MSGHNPSLKREVAIKALYLVDTYFMLIDQYRDIVDRE